MDLIQTNGMDQGLGLGIRDKIKKNIFNILKFFFLIIGHRYKIYKICIPQ